MAVLGLVLALLCAAFTADVVVENSGHHVSGTAAHQAIAGLSLGGVFVAGAILSLIFVVGLSMFFGGAARYRRRRALRREETARNVDRAEALRIRNERLEAELAAHGAPRDARSGPDEDAPAATAAEPVGRGAHAARRPVYPGEAPPTTVQGGAGGGVPGGAGGGVPGGAESGVTPGPIRSR